MVELFCVRHSLMPSIPDWPSPLIPLSRVLGGNHRHTNTHTLAHCLRHFASVSFLSLHIFLSCNSLLLLRPERAAVLPQAMINVIGAAFLFLFVRSREAVGELWHEGETLSLHPPASPNPLADCFRILKGKGSLVGY